MDVNGAIDFGRMVRGLSLKAVEGLTEQQLLKVPSGFKNNILWNLGHVLLYNCVFLYAPSGQPIPLPRHYHELFPVNSSPADWKSTPDVGEVLREFSTIWDRIASDYAAGKFAGFRGLSVPAQRPAILPPANSPNFFTAMELRGRPLATFEEALLFHCYHEGVHQGWFTSIRKFL